MIDIETNIADIQLKIRQLKDASGRAAGTVRLVAVSKKQTVEAIKIAMDAGQSDFGENYVQEAVAKIHELEGNSVVWHFIGAIQSNKTQQIASHFDWVHSIDRLKIAQRLNDQRPAQKSPLNVCLQINIDADNAKAGISPNNCLSLAQHVAAMPHLRLRGLMALPVKSTNVDVTTESFRRMHTLFTKTQQALGLEYFNSLSMGMSQDFELAVEEGATLLRIGTAIFGARSS